MERIQSLYNKVLSSCKLYHPARYNLSVLNKNGGKWSEKIETLVWELLVECDSVSSESADFGRISEVRNECEKQFQDFINGLEEKLNPTLSSNVAEIWRDAFNPPCTDQEMTALTGKQKLTQLIYLDNLTFNVRDPPLSLMSTLQMTSFDYFIIKIPPTILQSSTSP